MAQEPVVQGSQGGSGGDNQPTATDGGEGSGGEAVQKKPEQFVTPEIFQGALARHLRTLEEKIDEKLKKQIDATSKQFESTLASKLEESKAAPPAKGEGGKGNSSDTGAALLSLEKELKEAKALIEAERKARLQAETEAKDFKFRTKVEAALSRNKCTNTAAAFAVLQDGRYLTYDAENDKITAKVKDAQFGLGEVEVDLDTFLKTTFKEDILPQLFEGMVRPGVPATGDGGGANGKKGTIKISDISRMTPEQYAKQRDSIQEMLASGRLVDDR